MTDDAFDFGNLSVVESETDTSSDSPSGPECEVCGDIIPWAGRGRKPTKCKEHKSRTTPRDSDTPSTPRRTAAKAKRLEDLEAGLLKELTLFGKGMSKAMPVAGVTTVKRAPETAHALTLIAADNPRVFAVLETATKVLPVLDIGETAAMIGVAIMIDAGRLSPDGILPNMLGVTEIYDMVYPDDGRGQSEPVQREGTLTPFAVELPPRFAPVG